MSADGRRPDIAPASKVAKRIVEEAAQVVVGRPDSIRYAVYGMMANGHTLFEDVPGLAKTLLVNTLARAVGLDFNRIQFTPDLLPADITGSYIYNMKKQSFELRSGPVFTQILLADELNRAPPKTQAALLEAMQERQVTLEGSIHKLPSPFFVYATQNPIESEGVYILPEAELDRFMLRISMGYPTVEEEVEIQNRIENWAGQPPNVKKVADASILNKLQAATRSVYAHSDLKRYIATLIQATRTDERVLVGSSPRGTIALLQLGKAAACFHGRDFVTVDDIKEVAVVALPHRLLLRPEAGARGVHALDVIEDVLKGTPVPAVPEVARV